MLQFSFFLVLLGVYTCFIQQNAHVTSGSRCTVFEEIKIKVIKIEVLSFGSQLRHSVKNYLP